MPCHIELSNLALTYRWKAFEKPIFQEVNLCIEQGSFVTISGGNGSGKSTLIKLILGLIQPDTGQVLIDGVPVRPGYPEAVRQNRIAYLAQQIEDLFFYDTVKEELNHGGLKGLKPESIERLDVLGLEPLLNRGIESLSGGERQSLALIQFMASSAPLKILDEPSSYLDQYRASILKQYLLQSHQAGHTILHVTQYPSERTWGSHIIDLDADALEVQSV